MAEAIDAGVGGGGEKTPEQALREMMANPTFAMLVMLSGVALAIRAYLNLNPATGDWLLDRFEHDVAEAVARDPGTAEPPERGNAL